MLVALISFARRHSVAPKLPSAGKARASLLGEEDPGRDSSGQSSLSSAVTQASAALQLISALACRLGCC